MHEGQRKLKKGEKNNTQKLGREYFLNLFLLVEMDRFTPFDSR
jgi:hypothetical protein